jgi:hypothetical protein
MKKVFLVMLCVCLSVALVVPAFAGGPKHGSISVNQNQSQGVLQTQASMGGFGVSTQGYVTGANQAYVIQKSGNPSGIAGAATGSATGGNQFKLGNGFQTQGMLGSSVNDGKLAW